MKIKREKVPSSIERKVEQGDGVIQKYGGSWRIVSMKTDPPEFWNSHYHTREDAEKALSAYHANR